MYYLLHTDVIRYVIADETKAFEHDKCWTISTKCIYKKSLQNNQNPKIIFNKIFYFYYF